MVPQDTSIQHISPTGPALNAEHYQSYEVAKANDDVLAGDNIAQIRSYAAYARAQAQAIHKTIAATRGIDDVAAIKAEAIETEQTFARVGIYADQRIGEILRELPKSNRWKSDSHAGEVDTKADAIKAAGIRNRQAYDLQAMAANPEVVQAVLDKAEAEGKVASRAQVLKAIKERDAAQRARDAANEALAESERASALKDTEINSLRRRMAERPKPEVIEHEVVREVAPADYEDIKRRARDLENGNRMYSDTNNKLRKQLEDARKELDKAKDILGMDKTAQDVRRDVQYLITATNSYVRRYGGLTWTVQQLGEVDEPTLEQLRMAVRNLATFSNALMTSLEGTNE